MNRYHFEVVWLCSSLWLSSLKWKTRNVLWKFSILPYYLSFVRTFLYQNHTFVKFVILLHFFISFTEYYKKGEALFTGDNGSTSLRISLITIYTVYLHISPYVEFCFTICITKLLNMGEVLYRNRRISVYIKLEWWNHWRLILWYMSLVLSEWVKGWPSVNITKIKKKDDVYSNLSYANIFMTVPFQDFHLNDSVSHFPTFKIICNHYP